MGPLPTMLLLLPGYPQIPPRPAFRQIGSISCPGRSWNRKHPPSEWSTASQTNQILCYRTVLITWSGKCFGLPPMESSKVSLDTITCFIRKCVDVMPSKTIQIPNQEFSPLSMRSPISWCFYWHFQPLPLPVYYRLQSPHDLKGPTLCLYWRNLWELAWMTGTLLLWPPLSANALRGLSETQSALCCPPRSTHCSLLIVTYLHWWCHCLHPTHRSLQPREKEHVCENAVCGLQLRHSIPLCPPSLRWNSGLWAWTAPCAAGSWAYCHGDSRWSEWEARTPPF